MRAIAILLLLVAFVSTVAACNDEVPTCPGPQYIANFEFGVDAKGSRSERDVIVKFSAGQATVEALNGATIQTIEAGNGKGNTTPVEFTLNPERTKAEVGMKEHAVNGIAYLLVTTNGAPVPCPKDQPAQQQPAPGGLAPPGAGPPMCACLRRFFAMILQ